MLLLHACWSVLGQMAPYLILGFLISGVLSVMISPRWVEKHLGGGKYSSIIKATLLGVPLPLCSCGVIPVAASLRKHGANKGATTAFLISTPQTGADSILATYGLLGPFFAWFRPLAALITGIIGGLLVSAIDEDPPLKREGSHELPDEKLTLTQKIVSALNYGFIMLPGEIARALVVGIVIAGLISTFISADFVGQYIGNYYLTMLLMLALGIPIYVCSTSSIPIALGFMHMGVTPGAAFVFLISGPATNAAAISVVFKVLGRTSAIIYIATILIGSLAGGFVFDYLNQTLAINDLPAMQPMCHATLSLTESASAVFMIVILLLSWYKTRHIAACCGSCHASEATPNPDLIINIEGMSCGNCVLAVQRAILEIDGVTDATVLLSEKRADIFGKCSSEAILQTINDLGYTASLPQKTAN
ncbi:MAG: permease [Candidatus Riflebacteria bacterium]|nr:permease [Candidatus Riflebacteria bacterium]